MSGGGDYEDASITRDGVPLEQWLEQRLEQRLAELRSPPNSRGGKRPLAIWADLVEPYYDAEVARNGPFPSLENAREAVELLLKARGKSVPHHRTIERRIREHRPGWVRGA